MVFDNLEVFMEINCRTTPISEHMRLVPNCIVHPQLLAKRRLGGAETLKVPVQGEGTPGLSRPLIHVCAGVRAKTRAKNYTLLHLSIL